MLNKNHNQFKTKLVLFYNQFIYTYFGANFGETIYVKNAEFKLSIMRICM